MVPTSSFLPSRWRRGTCSHPAAAGADSTTSSSGGLSEFMALCHESPASCLRCSINDRAPRSLQRSWFLTNQGASQRTAEGDSGTPSVRLYDTWHCQTIPPQCMWGQDVEPACKEEACWQYQGDFSGLGGVVTVVTMCISSYICIVCRIPILHCANRNHWNSMHASYWRKCSRGPSIFR